MEITSEQLSLLKAVKQCDFNNMPGYDALGRKLQPGDYVYAISHAEFSHKLQRRICVVDKFTTKKITLIDIGWCGNTRLISVEPHNIIKVDEETIRTLLDFQNNGIS